MFGVIGIPVTQLASAAQACGIRFISCRNEQAAGYAASAAGFLTGVPGVLLTVSGPGVVHGLAGVSNAKANGWPMIMLSGSARSVRNNCLFSVLVLRLFCKTSLISAVRNFSKLTL